MVNIIGLAVGESETTQEFKADVEFEELIQVASRSLNVSSSLVELSYKDEDGDIVSIKSKEEFVEAVRIAVEDHWETLIIRARVASPDPLEKKESSRELIFKELSSFVTSILSDGTEEEKQELENAVQILVQQLKIGHSLHLAFQDFFAIAPRRPCSEFLQVLVAGYNGTELAQVDSFLKGLPPVAWDYAEANVSQVLRSLPHLLSLAANSAGSLLPLLFSSKAAALADPLKSTKPVESPLKYQAEVESSQEPIGCSPGQMTVFTWKIKNSGDVSWPSGTKLQIIDDDSSMLDPDTSAQSLLLPETLPGESREMSIPLRVPASPGIHQVVLRLVTLYGEGVTFGPQLVAQVQVRSENWQEELDTLEAMGFPDRFRNMKLLQDTDGNLAQVIEVLAAETHC